MLTSLASLALLYLAALIIPGPNLLLLTHTAASASRRAALGVAFGIATGTLLWVGIAVFGVQKIFEAAPMLQVYASLAAFTCSTLRTGCCARFGWIAKALCRR